jgi:hypothetical protein
MRKGCCPPLTHTHKNTRKQSQARTHAHASTSSSCSLFNSSLVLLDYAFTCLLVGGSQRAHGALSCDVFSSADYTHPSCPPGRRQLAWVPGAALRSRPRAALDVGCELQLHRVWHMLVLHASRERAKPSSFAQHQLRSWRICDASRGQRHHIIKHHALLLRFELIYH